MSVSNPIAKYHLVEMTLAARIREGAYDDGGLPGERELAAEFRVARVTIRHALKVLEDQGLVVRRQRRGTIAVSGRTGERRRLLREHIDKFLDRGRNDTRRVIRFEFVPAVPVVADALGVARGKPVLHIVRLRSDGPAPLTYTEAFVPERIAPLLTRAALNRKAFVQVLEESGLRIGAAEQRITAAGASPDVAAALKIPLQCPVLKVTRVLHDADGLPVQLLLNWYRADRFEFRMRLSREEDATKVWVEYH